MFVVVVVVCCSCDVSLMMMKIIVTFMCRLNVFTFYILLLSLLTSPTKEEQQQNDKSQIFSTLDNTSHKKMEFRPSPVSKFFHFPKIFFFQNLREKVKREREREREVSSIFLTNIYIEKSKDNHGWECDGVEGGTI